MFDTASASYNIIGAWMDDVELEFRRPSSGSGNPRHHAWSSLVRKDESQPSSPQTTTKRSRLEVGQSYCNPRKRSRISCAQEHMDDSTQTISVRETRSQRRDARNSSQPETVRSSSQSAYTASLNAERSSALRLTEVTTLTHTSSHVSRSSSPSSPGKARSRSPAKKVADLSSAVPPTYFSQLGASKKELPVHLRNLHRDIIGAGKRSVLPQSLRAELTAYLDEFDVSDDSLFAEATEGTLEQERSVLQQLLGIHKKARICYEQDKPEASWGEEVVRPLFDLALSNTNTDTNLPLDVVCENVTSAKICPTTLVPSGSGIAALPFEAKRVGYCLFLNPKESAASQIAQRLRRLPSTSSQSVNQSNATYIRSKVQIASVELKKSLSNTDPLLQLAIWNSALFTQLALLRRREAAGNAMMAVPSLSIAGHRWEICYTYMQERDADQDGAEQSRIMLGSVDFGSTMDVLGIYRIIRRVRAIANYGVREYWPWVQRDILLDEDGTSAGL